VIAEVLKLALTRAAEALPFGAVGIRCHALPVDENLEACLAGVRALLAQPGFERARCVIGSTGGADAIPPRTVVLQSDLAAAEATRIRNDPAELSVPGFRLIYLNSGSTPGEAGLNDVLVEVRAQALARHYAETAGLPLLAGAGRSRSRPVIARLEDTSIATLAAYAQVARDSGELVALPVLGLLPRSMREGTERPTPQWVSDFDAITSKKLIEGLVKGVRALEALVRAQRDRLAAALARDEGLLPPALRESADPVAGLIKLGAATRRYALGQEQDPSKLCGLSRRLLDLLRSEQSIVSRAANPDGGDEDEDEDEQDAPPEGGPGPKRSAALTERQILNDRGPEGLRGHLERFDVGDSGAITLALCRDDGDVVSLRPNDVHSVTWLSAEDAPRLINSPAAIEVEPEAVLLASLKPAKFKVRYKLDERPQSHPTVSAAIDALTARRHALVAAVGALFPAEETPRFAPEQRVLIALDAIPLTCVENTRAAAEAYVRAYVELMTSSFDGGGPLPNAVEKWLTHADLAVALDASQNAVASRLQPLHPLRIARSLLWLEKRSEPPVFPSVVVTMTGYSPVALYPHGERDCYHARPKSGPSREGIEAAVRSGLESAWSLLAPHGLVSALDVEMVDVVNTEAALEALYEAASDRFAADATVGNGVHLRVRFGYSEARGPLGIVCPNIAEMPELAGVAGAIPGTGVTVEVMPVPVQAGGEDVHIAINAVEAPFHGLQPSGPAGWGAKYIPGQSGNIIAVELTGSAALDSYRRLLGHYHKDTTAAFDPGLDSRGVGRALVRTYVAHGGWPIRPGPEDGLLAYEVVAGHVVATLADAKIFDAEVARRLAEFSAGGAQGVGDLQQLREGMLGLFPCRNFLADLLREGDERHLLGWLGILRAFRDAKRGPAGVESLTLSLDSPEGRAWVRATAGVFGTDQARADLAILEADLTTGTLRRIRTVELKARTSAKSLSTRAARAKLATQALVTAARLREVLRAGQPRAEELRDALRRFFWLGAGQQRAAITWRATLENFDKTLLGDNVDLPVKAECWVVPEEQGSGGDDVDEEMPSLDVKGAPVADRAEEVRVRVLQAVSRRDVSERSSEGESRSAAPSPARQPPSNVVELRPVPPITPAQLAQPVAPATFAPARGEAPREVAVAKAAEPPPPGWNAQLKPDKSAVDKNVTVTPVQEPAAPAPAAPAEGRPTHPDGVLQRVKRVGGEADTSEGLRVVLGQVLQGAKPEATWLPNRSDLVTHFNVGITGTMGSGKTQFTKSLLTQVTARGGENPGGKPPGILIFDYKGDYVDEKPGGFAHVVGARVLKPMLLPINPLRLTQPETPLDLKLATRQFAETIRTIAPGTGDVQRFSIIQAIEACLKDAGIDDAEPSTWGRPFPTVKDLHARLLQTKEVSGTPFAVIHDLAEYDIFARKDPGVEIDALLDGVTVVDLRTLVPADPSMIRAVISFFVNAFFSRMIQQGESLRESRAIPGGGVADVRQIRRLLVVDEADDFISLNLPSLKNVMQQGRAFGHGVILSTQFLHHFDNANNPLKPLVGTWVLHRMADVAPAVLRNLFGLSNDEAKALANTVNGLEVFTSIAYGLSTEGYRRKLARVRDLPFFELLSR
jgi:hypothetical protein